MKTNAATEYAATRKRVDEQVREVQMLLLQHANKIIAEPWNRALVDELLNVATILGEAAQFLGGSPEKPR